ncbi:hypothetical protein HXP44_29150 [Streptomyces sioyaensis]|uniref:Uncharacterized protein n=1 Tax=Streptomyces sioyaensis TaxID=67364 RepID=A0A4Q1R0X7_9ACTN|nr:hypothetical protein [Streptomyces sioyaensis]MBM4796003.1 hypothetical protein [Streptomyces sioyaensis]RXS65348.1 hypothetical protein EST54_18930 [Streptomyces sioyaensis]
MTGNQILSAVVALLAPLLTGAMGVLGILLKDRRKEKNRDHRLRRKIEIGQAEVQFIQEWLQARQQLGPLGQESRAAQEWLDRCYAEVESVQEEVSQGEVAPQKQIPVLRRLLLLRSLQGLSAQIWRIIYYVAFLGFNVYVVTVVVGFVQWIRGVPGASDLVGGSAILAILVMLCASAARAAAIRSDGEARKPAMPLGWPPRNVEDRSPRKTEQAQSWRTPYGDS